jgi:hypothetical protein
MDVSRQLHDSAALTPKKGPTVANGEETEWAHGTVSTLRRRANIAPAGRQTQTVQLVDLCYAGRAIATAEKRQLTNKRTEM